MVKEISMNHICKVEGHANLTLKIEKNKVVKCHMEANEGARFFEALVIGRKLEDVQEIVSRICGICSSAHSVASIMALEEAIKMKPTAQQNFIREMLMTGERIRSHTTHLYFLSLPDFYDKASALELGKEHKDKINDALEIITIGNKIVEEFGGREMHPFLKIKEEMPKENFTKLKDDLIKIKPKVIKTIKLFSSLKYPELTRKMDFLSLKKDDGYAIISGKIKSNSGKFDDDDYQKHIKENIKEYATSKFGLKEGEVYMLGATARINNNHEQLDFETKSYLKEAMQKLNLKFPISNPYQNLVCQAVEVLEAVNRAIKLIENFPKKEEISELIPKKGTGVSAAEAPRGTLFHDYDVSNEGIVTRCNIITPTAQSLNMMESDIRLLVNQLLEKETTKDEILRHLEKLIRAYDPCFSCSTHFLKVNWE